MTLKVFLLVVRAVARWFVDMLYIIPRAFNVSGYDPDHTHSVRE